MSTEIVVPGDGCAIGSSPAGSVNGRDNDDRSAGNLQEQHPYEV